LSMPSRYDNIELSADSVTNINFELNYCHANIYVKLKNAPFDATQNHWNIWTWGEPPYIYETWANGDPDSSYHFRVCDGEWYMQPPQSDTSAAFKINVTNEGLNYYVEFNYDNDEFTTGLQDVPKQVAHKFELKQNYPNPFNPTTTIDYQLAKDSQVMLLIYDIVGRELKTLVNSRQSAGEYKISFDASALPSGLYFYRLSTSTGYIETKKMLLVK
jgi:Secretion system C-terminal sorting domain